MDGDRAPPSARVLGHRRVIRVLVPTHLRSYTHGESEVDAAGATLGDALADLDARHPGIRFRIIDEQDRVRPHIKIFVGAEVAAGLAQPIRQGEEVMIGAALSGGRA